MDHYELIRRKVVIEGKSQRDVAKELCHSRETIAKALELRIPPGYRLSEPRPRPVIEPVKHIIDAWQKLTCLDFKDGSIKWTEGSLGMGALMMSTDGRMIIISDKGELAIARVNPEKFDLISRAQILPRTKCWTTPILANGKIYARNANGDMVCVDVSG